MALTTIFEPIRINQLEVPNRVVRTAHGTYLSSQRYIGGENLIAYHLARGKGGVGLSILEAAEVHPSCAHGVGLWDDRIIGSYRDLMKEIRPTGMRMFQQLWHGGGLYPFEGGGPAWGVSAVPSATGFVPVPMTVEQIEELQEAYVAAAIRVREGGLDGVEFHCCHGYLPMQFLSPVLNQRTDQYGGSLENRMRFTLETARKIRKAIGDDYVLGARIGVSKDSGVQLPEVSALIIALQSEGLLDYLNASMGDYYYHDDITGGMNLPTGFQIATTSQYTALARIPRIVVGRFRTLEEAQNVLNDGVADMVSMVRAHIADPAIVRKTKEGRVDEIRPCIACNQGCIGGLYRYAQVGCAINPAAGFEADRSEDLIRKAETPMSILIIGGGPAGMEAARVAALAGHRVKLIEATANLGGMIAVARRAPRLHTFGDIAYWLESEIYRLGVEVQLNTYMDAEDVLAEQADVVIVATGSLARMEGYQAHRPLAPIEGVDQPHVLSSVDVLTMPREKLGRSAVVFDDVGHFEGIAAAEYLIEQGISVTYVTSQYQFGGAYVVSTERDVAALERLYKGDFRMMDRAGIRSIGRDTCDIAPMQRNMVETVPADTVVLVTRNMPLREIYDAIYRVHPAVFLVGDAHAPRDAQEAIHEAHLTIRALDPQDPAARRRPWRATENAMAIDSRLDSLSQSAASAGHARTAETEAAAR